jgi:hypothetical protein
LRSPLPIAASIAQRPGYGGHAWAFLQYAFGARQLGYEPLFIDRLSAGMATGSDGLPSQRRRRAAIEWFRKVMDFAGLGDSCVLLLDDGETIGLSRTTLKQRIAAAPALINVMGFLDDPDLLEVARKRVFLDVDPGFPQIWRDLGQADPMDGHDRFASVGANLGLPRCEIPTGDLDWIGIRPPVSLSHWPVVDRTSRTFRSVGSWRGPYDPIEFRGRRLGLRVHEFRRFLDLPSRVDAAEFALAMDIDPYDSADVEALRANGWLLIDPLSVAASLEDYQDFIQSSGAEISIAKEIYVETNCGWFSDRSACFLASGRPVLAQDTGFGDSLPVGDGLLAFQTTDEAAAGAKEILGDWNRHAGAARAMAEEYFDARKVIGGLLAKLDEGS